MSSLEIAQGFLAGIQSSPSFDQHALSGLKVTTASPGTCSCQFEAQPHVLNRYGTLHGGCIATLVDTVTTTALATVSQALGVSVNLAVTYMSPVPGGQPLEVKATVVRAGRQLATIECDIMSGGKLCAKGLHTKFLHQVPAPSKPAPAPPEALEPRSKL
ncbi:HotDog domain-containing protein [Haematococcus lacustris]